MKKMGEMTMRELEEKRRREAAEDMMAEPTVKPEADVLKTYRHLAGLIDLAKDPMDTLQVLQEILEAYRDDVLTPYDYEVLTRIALDALAGQ